MFEFASLYKFFLEKTYLIIESNDNYFIDTGGLHESQIIDHIIFDRYLCIYYAGYFAFDIYSKIILRVYYAAPQCRLRIF